MYCSEHGTADFCPECLSEDKDKRIADLESALKWALSTIDVDDWAENGLNVGVSLYFKYSNLLDGKENG